MYKLILLSMLLCPPMICMKRVPNWTEAKFKAARELYKIHAKQTLNDSLAALKKQCKLNRKIIKKK